jgi:DNA-binding transcriptional regulator YiaG
MRELSAADLARAIPARIRRRLVTGQIESGEDVAMLRRFVGLSQSQFAKAMGISVPRLRNWEQGRRRPEGPEIGLLRIATRHPQIIRENLDGEVRDIAPRERLRRVVERMREKTKHIPARDLDKAIAVALRETRSGRSGR